jgi:hypothetical protein
MGQAKRRGTYEDRVKQATKDNIPCDLLIIKRSKRTPTLEFQYAQGSLPADPRVDRQAAINALHNDWGHDGTYIQIAGEYIAHSPSLQMARQGIIPKIMVNADTGVRQHIDLENLGCVIEFELVGEAITTTGPRWCTPEEVRAHSERLKQENGHTHSIRERQPA